MTLYNFNQVNYANAPTMTQEDLENSIPYIVSYLKRHKGKYFLMLEKEQRYYTLFSFPDGKFDPKKLAGEIITVAAELGNVKSIEEDNTKSMLEIWISNKKTKECSMYGLFNYDQGVIEL